MIRFRRRGGIWFLTFALLFGLLFQVIWLLEENLEPTLVHIARMKVKQIANEAVLEAAREQVKAGNELNGIMKVDKDKNGAIRSVQFDEEKRWRMYERTTSRMQEVLHRLNRKDIGVTLGQAMQNNILASYGPEIPIEIWPKGTPQVELVPRMESAGVNTVSITLMMEIHVEMEVVVPFTEEMVPLDTEIPVAQAVVVGEVPRFYYYNDMGGSIQKGKPGKNTGGEQNSPGNQPMPVLPPIQVD
ncbi:sporulation protein YunB [Salinithrix halophila]|uniref:Sporulation protein YunB n=1 Tax=Salinithrix halophila TaxID=1485204 RepID=A0ABV8JJK5_9BACL